MKYALVKVSKNRWVVARESQVISGEFRTATPLLDEHTARKVYDELRILGEERASESIRKMLL